MNDLSTEDKVLLAYIAGMLTIALVLPGTMYLSIRFVPPVRHAFRRTIESSVDDAVVRVRGQLGPTLQDFIRIADITASQAVHKNIAAIVHEDVAPRVADIVLEKMGAPID